MLIIQTNVDPRKRTGDGMFMAKTVVEARWRRYCEGRSEELPDFPMWYFAHADRRLGLRFLAAFDVVALLLDEGQIRRLMFFLGDLHWTKDILPEGIVEELDWLKQDQFMWLVARQCALVLECNGTFEQMAACWFRYDPQPFRGRFIDADLDIGQMRRLYGLPLIDVSSVCAGRPEQHDRTHPSFTFSVRPRDVATTVAECMASEDTEASASGAVVEVRSRLANDGTNRHLLSQWWDGAIERLTATLQAFGDVEESLADVEEGAASALIPDPEALVANVMNVIVHGDLGLTTGQVGRLSDKLNDASVSIDAREYEEATNKLMGFIAAVKQQVNAGKMNTATGDVIIHSTNAILAALSSTVED